MKILITGGAGFIGSHLVEELSDFRLTILDDFSTGRRENLRSVATSPNVEIVHGDVRDQELLAKLLEDVDVVFNLICRGVRHSIGNPAANHDVNATGTLRLLQAAREAGVQRLVHVSSSEVYGTARYAPMDERHACFPETVYGGAKLAGEAYARAYHRTYGLPVTVVRPFNNFGPRSHFEGDSGEVIPRFIVWALNGRRPVIFGDGSQTRDFIFVEETVKWLVEISRCDELVGQTVNLGSGTETSVLDLARIVYQEADQAGLEPIFLDPRPGDVMRLCADTTFAEESLGFQIDTDVRTGIRKTLDYFRNSSTAPAELLSLIDDVNWELKT